MLPSFALLLRLWRHCRRAADSAAAQPPAADRCRPDFLPRRPQAAVLRAARFLPRAAGPPEPGFAVASACRLPPSLFSLTLWRAFARLLRQRLFFQRSPSFFLRCLFAIALYGCCANARYLPPVVVLLMSRLLGRNAVIRAGVACEGRTRWWWRKPRRHKPRLAEPVRVFVQESQSRPKRRSGRRITGSNAVCSVARHSRTAQQRRPETEVLERWLEGRQRHT